MIARVNELPPQAVYRSEETEYQEGQLAGQEWAESATQEERRLVAECTDFTSDGLAGALGLGALEMFLPEDCDRSDTFFLGFTYGVVAIEGAC